MTVHSTGRTRCANLLNVMTLTTDLLHPADDVVGGPERHLWRQFERHFFTDEPQRLTGKPSRLLHHPGRQPLQRLDGADVSKHLHVRRTYKQVRVEPRTSALNMMLPAGAARALADIDRYLAAPAPGLWQSCCCARCCTLADMDRNAAAVDGTDRQTDTRTDGRTVGHPTVAQIAACYAGSINT